MQVTYGTITLDFTTLPPKSLEAMLKRGVTHFLGNEQASKVSGWKARLAEGSDEAPARVPSDEEVSAKKAEYVAAALAALQAGTVGTASRGPSVDPVEAEMDRIAKREIKAILEKNGAKFAGKGEDRKVTFADGSAFTMDELVDRRLANATEGARIKSEAEKAIRQAAKQAEKAKGAGPLDLGSIG